MINIYTHIIRVTQQDFLTLKKRKQHRYGTSMGKVIHEIIEKASKYDTLHPNAEAPPTPTVHLPRSVAMFPSLEDFLRLKEIQETQYNYGMNMKGIMHELIEKAERYEALQDAETFIAKGERIQ